MAATGVGRNLTPMRAMTLKTQAKWKETVAKGCTLHGYMETSTKGGPSETGRKGVAVRGSK